MSNKYLKKMSAEKLRDKVVQRIGEQQFTCDVLEAILPALQHWEGKKVTKRIKAKIQERVPFADVYYQEGRIPTLELEFRPTGAGYHDTRTFRCILCWKGGAEREEFDVMAFKQHNICHFADFDRLKKNKIMLAECNFEELAERYNKIIADLKRLSEDTDETPIHYEFDLEQSRNSDTCLE